MNQKKRGNDGKRDRLSMVVPCPVQIKYYHYHKTFHLFNKGNGAERPYNMGGKSHMHNWSLKFFSSSHQHEDGEHIQHLLAISYSTDAG